MAEVNNPERRRRRTAGERGITKRTKLVNLRARYKVINENCFRLPPLAGVEEVNILTPDDPNNEDQSSDIMSICWTQISAMDAKDERLQMCGMIVSAVGAFAPDMLNTWLLPLREDGAAIQEIRYPSVALEENYRVLNNSHSYKQHLIYCALLFVLPFKNITELNYDNYIAARLKDMIGLVGMTEREADQIQFPLDLAKAEAFAVVFSQSIEIKRGVIEYIMWASQEMSGDLMRVARYVCALTAWSEMNMVVRINNTLLATNSPVLNYTSVKPEVRTFCKLLAEILRSDRPQYFRYFCTQAQEQLLHRNNYPNLAQAAIMGSMNYSRNQLSGSQLPKSG